jgi:hypothetical protein
MTAPALSEPTPFGRYYGNPNRPYKVPSITNIKDAKGINALKYWAAREAAEYAADNMDKLAPLARDEIVSLIKGAPFARSSARAESSRIGDVVHAWVDRWIKGEGPPAPDELAAEAPAARNMWRQFMAVITKYDPQFTMSEFTVWSDTYGYAGTADWAANVGGALVLGDTKTGKGVYEDTAMQLAALAKADIIIDTEGNETPVPQFERFAILHLRPTFARLIPVTHIDEAFKQFLGCKAIFDFNVEYHDKVLMFAPKIQAAA